MRPRRVFNPDAIMEENLANDLYAIGMNLTATRHSTDPNIEDTLVLASIWAVVEDDSRIGGLLVDWISIHYLRMNVDRLTKLVFDLNDGQYNWVRIFWSANAQRLLAKDKRFKRLAELYSSGRFDFIDRFKSGNEKRLTEAYLSMKGEDERFVGTCLRVPNGPFSHRPQQIFSAEEVSRSHFQFRYRVMFGPSYRADVWALLRRNPDLTGYRLALLAHCSRPAATRVKHDYEIVKRDYSKRGKAV